MRMWMVNPRCLCVRHLIGEHGEIHKFRHNFVKGHKIEGRKGQIVPSQMKRRHDELVTEMLRRGYQHKSPYAMPSLALYGDLSDWKVDEEKSLEDLKSRCPTCKERIEAFFSIRHALTGE